MTKHLGRHDEINSGSCFFSHTVPHPTQERTIIRVHGLAVVTRETKSTGMMYVDIASTDRVTTNKNLTEEEREAGACVGGS